MDEKKYLSEYYGAYNEDDRLSSKHGRVELLTTMKYVDAYLKKGMRVLEVGAGTGRYSLSLAERGFKVDAVELIERNIEIFESKITKKHDVTVRQGNAVDLSCYGDNTFDITLLLGPMYHLFDLTDKRAAVSEVIRVTKKGGVVFAAYCMNEATVVNWGFVRGNIPLIKENKMLDDRFKCLSNPSLIFEMYRKEDIDAVMSGFPVERLHFVATDLFTHYISDAVDAMDDEVYKAYIDYHFTVCERQDLTGITNHSLDIFRVTK